MDFLYDVSSLEFERYQSFLTFGYEPDGLIIIAVMPFYMAEISINTSNRANSDREAEQTHFFLARALEVKPDEPQLLNFLI